MDEIQLRTMYLFSDQKYKDKMVMNTIIEVYTLRQQNMELQQKMDEILHRFKGPPDQLIEMDYKSPIHKNIS